MAGRNGNVSGAGGTGVDRGVVDWLLEPDQPAVRYYALVDLLGRKPEDPEVRRALAEIPRRGWGADLLGALQPSGLWEEKEPRNVQAYVDFLYQPKYVSSNWKALVVSDLGLTSSQPKIRRLAERFFEYKLRLGSPFNYFHEEVCVSGNTARILTRFGYGDDRRVRMLFDWLVEDQREDGGWNCSQGTPGTLDGWEAMAAFAALPPSARTGRIEKAIDRGAEFYLDRGLFREGKSYPPWRRLHYPNHYYYDILVGLDFLTRLGYGGDRRLQPALQILQEKRQRDGSWLLERVHPDAAGSSAQPYLKKVKPFALEEPGQPSKWITLQALRVLKRVEDAS
ncbi:MAG TPA: hypothetical protein VMH90_07065 [Thermoplasmata archaeon]|nr:hypothetical protein [Thermoplasmata archaeon]